MSALAPWLLAIALGWPSPPFHVEGPAARRERLAVAASALGWAVDVAVMTGALPGGERRAWAALALATVERESGWLDRRVHAGERLGDGGRSICFGQINRGNPGAIPVTGWRSLAGVGDEASRRCAWAIVRTFEHARRYCARRVPRAELALAVASAYLHGRGCHVTAEGRRRVRLAASMLASPEYSGDGPSLGYRRDT